MSTFTIVEILFSTAGALRHNSPKGIHSTHPSPTPLFAHNASTPFNSVQAFPNVAENWPYLKSWSRPALSIQKDLNLERTKSKFREIKIQRFWNFFISWDNMRYVCLSMWQNIAPGGVYWLEASNLIMFLIQCRKYRGLVEIIWIRYIGIVFWNSYFLSCCLLFVFLFCIQSSCRCRSGVVGSMWEQILELFQRKTSPASSSQPSSYIIELLN